MLDYSTAGSLLVPLVYWTTASLIVFTLLLFITVILLRLRNAWLEKKKKRFRARWRPLLFQWLTGQNTNLPVLRRSDAYLMLELWLKVRQNIDDSSAEKLNQFALNNDLDLVVARILQYRSAQASNSRVWLQLQAIRVAQALDTAITRDALQRAADSFNLRVNVEATCALVQINHDHAELEVLSTLLRFYRWTPYIALKISRSGGADLLHLVGQHLDKLDDEQIRNLISLIELSDDRTLVPFLLKRLESTNDVDEMAALLRALARLGGPEYKAQIANYLQHDEVALRVTAAAALGKLGNKEDYRLLQPLLSDPDWWVRYRSAQSILALNPMSLDTLNEYMQVLTDPFARDILRQVHAETVL